jgi:hypothetical protein
VAVGSAAASSGTSASYFAIPIMQQEFSWI